MIGLEEVAFESSVFLLKKSRARILKNRTRDEARSESDLKQDVIEENDKQVDPDIPVKPKLVTKTTQFRVSGTVPSEVWNRLGTKLLSWVRSGSDFSINIDISVSFPSQDARYRESELRLFLDDMELGNRVRIEKSSGDQGLEGAE